MKEVEHLDFHDIDDRSKLSQLVEKLTKTFLLFLILSNLVKSIIIGGGHNNSYGNIKGTALQGKHKCH
jgi:formiminoglutamase